MKELGVLVLGDRINFLEFLKQLKKHKRDADRSKSLWSGTTPVLGLAYHKNCGQFCFHVSFPWDPMSEVVGVGTLGHVCSIETCSAT